MFIKPMLAASEIPLETNLKFPLMVSYKLDGIRSLMIDGRAMSRKMLVLSNLYLQEWAKEYATALHGLDGEVIVGQPYGEGVFQRSGSGITSIEGEPDFTFYVFEKWDSTRNARVRFAELSQQAEGIPRVYVLPQMIVHNVAQLKEVYAQALSIGYEGLILKNPLGAYKNGRSTVLEGTLLKWKEWADSEAVILGFKEGSTNTNVATKDELGHTKRSSAKEGKIPKDTLGSFLVKDIYSGVEFSASTGNLTVTEAKEFWDNRENLVGKIIVYKFQKSGVKDKPRFPGFKGFRSSIDIL